MQKEKVPKQYSPKFGGFIVSYHGRIILNPSKKNNGPTKTHPSSYEPQSSVLPLGTSPAKLVQLLVGQPMSQIPHDQLKGGVLRECLRRSQKKCAKIWVVGKKRFAKMVGFFHGDFHPMVESVKNYLKQNESCGIFQPHLTDRCWLFTTPTPPTPDSATNGQRLPKHLAFPSHHDLHDLGEGGE